MAKIIAICGKICSGKTYYAQQLKEKERAVILSCDELTGQLFDTDLEEKHDEMISKVQRYLRRKAIELVNLGCSVIFDWGFWSFEERRSLTAYFQLYQIPCEWHYVEVDNGTWMKNIADRNRDVLKEAAASDYFIDEGLLSKFLSKWEAPSREEIDIWHTVRR